MEIFDDSSYAYASDVASLKQRVEELEEHEIEHLNVITDLLLLLSHTEGIPKEIQDWAHENYLKF